MEDCRKQNGQRITAEYNTANGFSGLHAELRSGRRDGRQGGAGQAKSLTYRWVRQIFRVYKTRKIWNTDKEKSPKKNLLLNLLDPVQPLSLRPSRGVIYLHYRAGALLSHGQRSAYGAGR